jgi:hypothetical protein
MSAVLADILALEKKLSMDAEPGGGNIIAYTRSGKPIYDQYGHPANRRLTSIDLQYPTFHAHDQAVDHSFEMKKHLPGSAQYLHHGEQMLGYVALYKFLGKLWRSASAREKKRSTKT